MEIARVETHAFRLIWEFYSVFHTDGVLKSTFVSRKDIITFLQTGQQVIGQAVSLQRLNWFMDAYTYKKRDEINVTLLQRQLKDLKVAPEEIERQCTELVKNKENLFDIRYLILHMYSYIFSGVIMVKEIDD